MTQNSAINGILAATEQHLLDVLDVVVLLGVVVAAGSSGLGEGAIGHVGGVATTVWDLVRGGSGDGAWNCRELDPAPRIFIKRYRIVNP